MSKGKPDSDNAVTEPNESAANQAATAKADPKFPIVKLRAKCLHVFGVTVSTFDGATYGMTEEYSIEEIKTALKKWGEMEVK